MNANEMNLIFSLLHSAVCALPLADEVKSLYHADLLPRLVKLAKHHDVLHLLALGLKKNGLLDESTKRLESEIFRAVSRYEQQEYELKRVCEALENAEIPFIPLKGSVLRRYYPEPWMRTSCDIDILVRNDDLDRATRCLTENLKYTEKERATHDISFYSPTGIHVELHFDLIEEGRANNAIEILCAVWENVSLCEDSKYRYEMSDEFFYFFHMTHMAKHFETGGCGIRPFLDLYILDRMEHVDREKRDSLLAKGDLLRFTNTARKLCAIWFCGAPMDDVSQKMQAFLLHGGVYGSAENRVALQQKKNGGRGGYILSRIFIPSAKLKRYYPILNAHPWLMPLMQIRRWFMLLKPDIAQMAKREIATNKDLSKNKAAEMHDLLDDIGL